MKVALITSQDESFHATTVVACACTNIFFDSGQPVDLVHQLVASCHMYTVHRALARSYPRVSVFFTNSSLHRATNGTANGTIGPLSQCGGLVE